VDPYRAWLAQMPRKFVRERIGELEKELTLLRELDRLPVPGFSQAIESAAEKAPASETRPAASGATTDRGERPRRRRKMSQERVAIIDAVGRLRPDAGPAEVAEMTGQELSAVQKTMSRMARDGQLVRLGYRRYDLPPPDDAGATLLNGSDESSATGDRGGDQP